MEDRMPCKVAVVGADDDSVHVLWIGNGRVFHERWKLRVAWRAVNYPTDASGDLFRSAADATEATTGRSITPVIVAESQANPGMCVVLKLSSTENIS